MKRLLTIAALAVFCLVPALVSAQPPKPAPKPQPAPAPAAQPATHPQPQPTPQPATPPQPSPRPRRAAAPGEDIDWLSEFGLGGDPSGPAAGQRPNDEERMRAIRNRNEALDRMRRQDPERYNRLIKIRRLAHDYRRADDPKRKAAIEKELAPLVDQELRIQHQSNKKRIAEMERRLAEAKQVMDEREKNWDKVVDFSVKEITGQNAYLRAVHHHDRDRNRNRHQR